MSRLLLLGSVLFVASTCSKQTAAPSPVPVSTDTTPVPTATVPDPTPAAGSPSVVTASCLDAFNKMVLLHCPPEEDAHDGWLIFECPKLSQRQVTSIVASSTCVETRQAQEAP